VEIFTRGSDHFINKEAELDIGLTSEASRHLKSLITRPNPNLAEFAFLGLGQGDLIDQILVSDVFGLEEKRGLYRENDHFISRIENDEWIQLFVELEAIKRSQDLLILGHLHPSGEKHIEGIPLSVSPSNALLEASMGDPQEGGPSSARDVGFIKGLITGAKIDIPYFGIAAITRTGPKLRIYQTNKLIMIKQSNDIYSVPQVTITL